MTYIFSINRTTFLVYGLLILVGLSLVTPCSAFFGPVGDLMKKAANLNPIHHIVQNIPLPAPVKKAADFVNPLPRQIDAAIRAGADVIGGKNPVNAAVDLTRQMKDSIRGLTENIPVVGDVTKGLLDISDVIVTKSIQSSVIIGKSLMYTIPEVRIANGVTQFIGKISSGKNVVGDIVNIAIDATPGVRLVTSILHDPSEDSNLPSEPTNQPPIQGPLKFSNGDVYDGQVRNGVPHGRGKYIFSNGDICEGQFHEGELDGQAQCKLTFPDGETYEGQWSNKMRHGSGKMVFKNGCIYNGQWNNDERHGQGVLTLLDGNSYNGQWSHDMIHGKGKFTFSNGNVYDGEWQNNKMHGKGELKLGTGGSFKGQFADGQFVG
jgi:hypothetical protein